jgi:hypothetical protein
MLGYLILINRPGYDDSAIIVNCLLCMGGGVEGVPYLEIF